MSNPNSVGGESGAFPASTDDVSQTRVVKTTETALFSESRRKSEVLDGKSQTRLRARVKSVLPVPLYCFIVRLVSSSQPEQKSLGNAIYAAHRANKEAWDALGQGRKDASPQQSKVLQLACEKTQLKLDHLEGHQDSPVTTQRTVIIRLLESASEASERTFPDIKAIYLAANDQLKRIQQHEMTLEADLGRAQQRAEAAVPRTGSAD